MIQKSVHLDVKDVFNADEYLYFYQKILTPDRLQNEMDFLVKYTFLDRPLKILELACGHGRHANALAALGHEVIGIDITNEFLEVAKKEASKTHLQVEYLIGDMRNIQYQNSFDRVNAMFTAIGYFDDTENEDVFQKIYQALKPGGFFCFDSHNRDAFLSYYRPTSVLEREGNWMIDQQDFDTLTGRTKTKRTIIKDGISRSFDMSIRFYNPTEIATIFKRIGFSTIHFYGGWDGKDLDKNSNRMIIVAQK